MPVTLRDKIVSIFDSLHSKCGAEESHALTSWRDAVTHWVEHLGSTGAHYFSVELKGVPR